MDFEEIWKLLKDRGRVAHFYRGETEALWGTYSPEQQQQIYASIKRKLDAGNCYVDYRPPFAIRDNAPKTPKIQIITADEYYRRYNTQTNYDGWVRTFLPDQQRTIYVKNN